MHGLREAFSVIAASGLLSSERCRRLHLLLHWLLHHWLEMTQWQKVLGQQQAEELGWEQVQPLPEMQECTRLRTASV